MPFYFALLPVFLLLFSIDAFLFLLCLVFATFGAGLIILGSVFQIPLLSYAGAVFLLPAFGAAIRLFLLAGANIKQSILTGRTTLYDMARDSARIWGGKSVWLHRMHSAGLPVLEGLCVKVPKSNRGRKRLARLIAKRFENTEKIIIRSSHPWEDSQITSFAGLFESLVCDPEPNAITEALKQVVEPQNKDALKKYAATHGLSKDMPEVRILVQRHIQSGLFATISTVDPVNGLPFRYHGEFHQGGMSSPGFPGFYQPISGYCSLEQSSPTMKPVAKRMFELASAAQMVAGRPLVLELYDDGVQSRLLQARPVTGPAPTPVYVSRPYFEAPNETLSPLMCSLLIDSGVLSQSFGRALSLLSAKLRRVKPDFQVFNGRLYLEYASLSPLTGRFAPTSLDLWKSKRLKFAKWIFSIRLRWNSRRIRTGLRNATKQADSIFESIGSLRSVKESQKALDQVRRLILATAIEANVFYGDMGNLESLFPDTIGTKASSRTLRKQLLAKLVQQHGNTRITGFNLNDFLTEASQPSPMYQLLKQFGFYGAPYLDPARWKQNVAHIENELRTLARDKCGEPGKTKTLRQNEIQRENARCLLMRGLFLSYCIIAQGLRVAKLNRFFEDDSLPGMISTEEWLKACTNELTEEDLLAMARQRLAEWRNLSQPEQKIHSAIIQDQDGWQPVMDNTIFQGPVGVSFGEATGKAVVFDPESGQDLQSKIILMDQENLAVILHINKIHGIIMKNGSPICHLALCAREAELPMVVRVPEEIFNDLPGQEVFLNGETGAVYTIEKFNQTR